MSLFPRVFASEFAPVFRLLDDYAVHAANRTSCAPVFSRSLRSFQPRFDVKENKDSYELHGEVPGVQREGLSIEFTDQQTLSIKGRTESHREEGTRLSAHSQVETAAPTPAAIEGQLERPSTPASEADSDFSGYQKATVEDEDGVVRSTLESTPHEIPEARKETVPTTDAEVQTKQPEQTSSRYWVSERSVGTFARSFQFPSRVDQENVKASLENGILSIIVPKASAPVSRRIQIQ